MEKKIIRPEIKNLLKEVVGNISVKDVILIVDKRQHNLEESIALLTKYDKKIGGKGIHNINRPDGRGGWTGNYLPQDRPIYRSIQYIEAYLTWETFEWITRDFVAKSCLHVESCLRRYCRDTSRRMFGTLLNSKEGTSLPKQLWDQLNRVRILLYNPAKHYIPDYENHLFTDAEAIAAYFICRRLGLKLLKLIT